MPLSVVRSARVRIFLLVALGVLAAGGGLSWTLGWFAPRPNILLITLDTTRADRLGCYGHEGALTPTLDALAAEGVLFERAYSPAPLTLPAHATMLTGLYPPEHGLLTNGRNGLGNVPTLASLLQEKGYETGAFVASFVLHKRFGLDRGFATYDDDLSGEGVTSESLQRQRDGESVVDAALKWLQPRRKPYFCWVHLYDPHHPYVAHGEFGDRFRDNLYDGEIAYADQQVQRLIDAVAARGDNTLILVVGDHGEGLGEHVEKTHGFTLYNSTQHVPMIWHWAGKLPAGKRIASEASLADILPTIAVLLRITPRAAVSGTSLRPAWEGGVTSPSPVYAATVDPHLQNGWAPLRSYTGGGWRYIETPRPELYDLNADPGETRNLHEEHPDVASNLRKRLLDWEAGMVRRRGNEVAMTPQERRTLESLGYVGGSSGETGADVVDRTDLADLPDIKEMLQFDVETQEALDLLRSGRPADAARQLEDIARRAPKHVASRVFLGEAYEALEQYDQALAAYLKALDINSEYLDARIHLASLLAAQGNLAEAEKELLRSLEIDQDSAEAHYNLGLVYARLGRTTDARREFDAALWSDPYFPNAHAALGNLFAAQGDWKQAEAEFLRELEGNSDSAEANLNLGAILSEQGQIDEAATYLLKAAELSPRSAAAHFNLGVLFETRGELARAEAEFQKAAELDPKNERASSNLKRVRAARQRIEDAGN